MKLRVRHLSVPGMLVPFAAAVLAGCSVISGGGFPELPSLPDQPELAGANPISVTIVLPDDVFKTLPPAGPDAHSATEAQLEAVETFALSKPLGLRRQLDERVNACRFSARQSCVILPESKAEG